jgi:hypothetical protein
MRDLKVKAKYFVTKHWGRQNQSKSSQITFSGYRIIGIQGYLNASSNIVSGLPDQTKEMQ